MKGSRGLKKGTLIPTPWTGVAALPTPAYSGGPATAAMTFRVFVIQYSDKGAGNFL